MASSRGDPAMQTARELFKKAEISLEKLGQDMGYEKQTARKSAWQFLNKTIDPRLSMLRKFAKALGIPVKDLL